MFLFFGLPRAQAFSHYVIQQNLYTYMLVCPRAPPNPTNPPRTPPLTPSPPQQEHNYNIKVDSMWLVQLHPVLKEAHCVQVPRCDETVQKIMTMRCEEVRSKRMRSD